MSLGWSRLSCFSAPVASKMGPAGVGDSTANAVFIGNMEYELTVWCNLQNLLMLDVISRESCFPEWRSSGACNNLATGMRMG